VLKRANRVGARRLVMVGEQEALRGVVTVKDLGSGEQREVSRQELVKELGR
jgi:histidyl-tRNA synthetase